MSPQPLAPFPWKRNLAVLWVVQVLTTLGFSFTFPFFPIFFQELGIAEVERAAFWSGLSGWAMGIGMGLFSPLWGVMGDRFGRKLNILRAMALAGVLMVISGYAQTPFQLLAMRFFVGAASGVVPTIMALVAAHTPRERLLFAAGATMSALFLGIAVGPVFGGLIFDHFGLRAAFWATGLALLFSGGLVVVFVREKFVRPAAGGGDFLPSFVALWRMATSREFLPLLVILFLVQSATMLAYPAVPGIVEGIERGARSATVIGFVFMAAGIASAVSSVLVGWLVGKLGLRNVLTFSAAAASIAALGPYFADTLVGFMLAMAGVSLFAGGLGGLVNGLIALRAPPDRQSAAFGATQSANSLAIAIGPLLGGSAAVVFGLRSVFLLNVGAFALVLVFAVVLIGSTRAERGDAHAAGG